MQVERHERETAAMKEGWQSELKRQKNAWNGAEKIRRQRWMENQLKEIKQRTIKV